MPKWLKVTLIVVVVLVGTYLLFRSCLPPQHSGGATHTVEVTRDSVGVYHVDSSDKLIRIRPNDQVTWTFVPDSTVDSVVAIFDPTAGNHPFLTTRFEFSAGSATSDSIVVAPDTSHTYLYRITIFQGPDTTNADPGIIIED